MHSIKHTQNLTLIKRIGKGSYGTIYLANFNDTQVAVKKENQESKTIIDPKEESRILKMLPPSPQLLTWIADFRDGFAMNYVAGINLKSLLKDHEFELSDILRISIQLCMALSLVHQAGIIHCDIKLSNTLYHSDGNIVLIDFGLAMEAKNADHFADRRGSPAYMAPEIIDFYSQTFASDIYSLGILFWSLQAGDAPYINPTEIQKWFDQILKKRRPGFTEAHRCAAYNLLIMRMWSQKPRWRVSLTTAKNILKSMQTASSRTINKRSYVSQNNRFRIFSDSIEALWRAVNDNNVFLVDRILCDIRFDPRWLTTTARSHHKNTSLLLTAIRLRHYKITKKFVTHPQASAVIFYIRDDHSTDSFLSEVLQIGDKKIAALILRCKYLDASIFDSLFIDSNWPLWMTTSRKEANQYNLHDGHFIIMQMILAHPLFSRKHFLLLKQQTLIAPDSNLAESFIYKVYQSLAELVECSDDEKFKNLFAKQCTAKLLCESLLQIPNKSSDFFDLNQMLPASQLDKVHRYARYFLESCMQVQPYETISQPNTSLREM